MEFKNICNYYEDFYDLCKENGWTDSSYEDWYNNGEELQFFEGDPDMIKVNGNIGYFAKIDDTVWFWFDDYDSTAEMMLRKFFSCYQTGITLGGESWIAGTTPDCVVTKNSWKEWEEIETGFAYRGGAGYCYWITDWSEWLEMENKKPIEQLHEEYFNHK